MGSTPEYADYVIDQLDAAGEITRRKMFGEYAVYVGTKVVGFICDDRLFAKITDAGLELLADAELAVEYGKPYPGAKDYVVVTFLDDVELVTEFVRTTVDALPEPAQKRQRRKRS